MTYTALVTCNVMGYTTPYVWTLDPLSDLHQFLTYLHYSYNFYYIDTTRLNFREYTLIC